MRSQETVLAYLAEANPVPDETILTFEETAGADYIAFLAGRETAPRTLRMMPTQQRTRMWVAATAAFVVLGVSILVTSLNSDDEAPPATDPTPTTQAESTLTTIATPIPTTPVDPSEEAWNQQTPWLGVGTGAFRTNHFGVPFAFSMGDTIWRSGSQTEDAISLHVELLAVFVDVLRVPSSVEEALGVFDAMHESIPEASMTEPAPTELDGALGVRFETTGLPILAKDMLTSASLLPDGVDFFTVAGPNGETFVVGGEQGEVYILDVEGQTVIVALRAAKVVPGVLGGGAPPDDVFDAARQSARHLVETIIWKDTQ